MLMRETQLSIKPSDETASDAVWMSVLAGLGAVAIEVILVGGFYLFDPIAKMIIESHSWYFLISLPVLFVAGFGFSLQLELRMQFWRGKWK
jgi:hypothetical protein